MKGWMNRLSNMKKLFATLALASGFVLSGCAADYYGDYAGYGPGYSNPGYYGQGYYGPAYYGPGYYGYYDAYNDPFFYDNLYGPGLGLYGGYYGGGGYGFHGHGFHGGGFHGHGGGGFHGGHGGGGFHGGSGFHGGGDHHH